MMSFDKFKGYSSKLARIRYYKNKILRLEELGFNMEKEKLAFQQTADIAAIFKIIEKLEENDAFKIDDIKIRYRSLLKGNISESNLKYYYLPYSKEILDKITLSQYETEPQMKKYIDENFKEIYHTIKMEIIFNYKSEILEKIKTNQTMANIIRQYIKEEIEEMLKNSFVANINAMNTLRKLIKTEDYLNIELLVNLYKCTNPEEMKIGIKKHIQSLKEEYSENINKIEQEYQEDIIITNNKNELAQIACRIRRIIAEKKERISYFALSLLLLAGLNSIIPIGAKALSTEAMITEKVYTVEDDEEKLISETSSYGKMYQNKKVTLRIYDGSINYDGTQNYDDCEVTKTYVDLKSLIREELKSREIEDLGEYKEIIFSEKDINDKRLDEECYKALCITSYVLSLVFGGGAAINNIYEYFGCNGGIKYQNRRKEESITLIEKTVDEYLEKVYENAQLEERLYEIIESSSFTKEEKEIAKELVIQKKRSQELEDKLKREKEVARVYRK